MLAKSSDELALLDSSSSSSDINSSKDSPDPEDDPPPLQEITRRLKINTIRKKNGFFIFFP